MAYLDRLRVPSALQIACRTLEEAQRLRLQHAKDKEYHIAMEAMLVKRIARLKDDIRELTPDTADSADQS